MSSVRYVVYGAMDAVLCAVLVVLFIVVCACFWVFGGKDARRELADNYDEDAS